MRRIIALLLSCGLAAGIAAAQTTAPRWMAEDPQFGAFMERFKKGMDAFLNGDPTARAEIEYLSGRISGELAYTVAIERSRVHIVGQKEPAVMQLRVTHVYGKEHGKWKLLHRHADPLIAKTAPGDVLAH